MLGRRRGRPCVRRRLCRPSLPHLTPSFARLRRHQGPRRRWSRAGRRSLLPLSASDRPLPTTWVFLPTRHRDVALPFSGRSSSSRLPPWLRPSSRCVLPRTQQSFAAAGSCRAGVHLALGEQQSCPPAVQRAPCSQPSHDSTHYTDFLKNEEDQIHYFLFQKHVAKKSYAEEEKIMVDHPVMKSQIRHYLIWLAGVPGRLPLPAPLVD